MMRFGTSAQLNKYLPPIKAGQAIWCQGFSEPSAGSDLAALRTLAEPVEGGYRVTGAKIWTSRAHVAHYMIALVRSIAAGGVSVLIIEHVLEAVMRLSARIVVLNHGEVIAQGRPDELVNDARVIDAYLGEAYSLA